MTGRSDGLRIEVDPAVCVGIGACGLAAADAIAGGNEDVATPTRAVLPPDSAGDLRDVCPIAALHIVDDRV